MATVPVTSLPLVGTPPTAPEHSLEKLQMADRIGELARSLILDLDEKLPYVDCAHPDGTLIQERTMDWIKRFKILPKGKLYDKALNAKFGIFIGKCHPRGHLETVTTVALFATWLFIYDDLIEKMMNIDEIKSLHARSIHILKGGGVSEEDMPLMQGLQEIVERIDQKRPSALWKERFISEHTSYCKSTVFESLNRLQKRVPTLSEYLIERPEFSGTKVMFTFDELIEELTIPQEIYESPLVKRILLLAANAVNWENDFLSAKKEFLEDDVHNLIFVLQQEYDFSIEEAFRCGGRMFERNLQQLSIAVKEAQNESDEVQRHVKGIMEWLAGHHFWAKASPRYSFFFTSPRLERRGDVKV